MQYCKLIREHISNADEGMGYIRIKTNECKYKEKDRRLKEQFIYGINYIEMVREIIHKLSTVKKTSKITRDHILAWARRVEVQKG